MGNCKTHTSEFRGNLRGNALNDTVGGHKTVLADTHVSALLHTHPADVWTNFRSASAASFGCDED
jgi:hypothetical protein